MIEIRNAAVDRYIMPLREGGSLPALAQADDGFKYVVKFGGGGHGTKSLIAELIGGEIARRAGLKVPELVFLDVNEDFGRTEPDQEIQDLLKASLGTNIGLHFLSGAFAWDAASNRTDPMTASRIVWVDAILTNVDRTSRNTNMLLWNHELWLIDHGSSLYFHHSWTDWQKAALSPFPYIKDHALLRQATRLVEADKELRTLITPEFIDELVDTIPTEWLEKASAIVSAGEQREVYRKFLKSRLENSKTFVDHAIEAAKASV